MLALKPLIREKAKENQQLSKGRGKKGPQNSAEVKPAERETRHQLAKLAGVSHDTIAKVKMILAEADEETKQALLNADGRKC